VLGEVLADEIISALSQTPELNVISRLSTTVRGRESTLVELRGQHASLAKNAACKRWGSTLK
jgi:adenylate cyclase